MSTPVIQTYHQYAIYNHGVYLGLLQNVNSPYQLNETINTAGAQLAITVGQSADIASQAISPIQDELGAVITDETGSPLLPEHAPDIVGSSSPSILIQNDNDIIVTEFNQFQPNGVVVFQGYISKWKATYGKTDDILITCLSYGQDLSNYVAEAGFGSYIHQTIDDSTVSGAYWGCSFAQAFTPTTAPVISGVQLKLSSSDGSTINVTPFLCLGDPSLDTIQVVGGNFQYNFGAGNSVIATASSQAVTTKTPTVYGFTLPATQTLTNGQEYYWLLQFGQNQGATLVIETCKNTDSPDSHYGRLYYKDLVVNNSGPFALAYDGTNSAMYNTITTQTGATQTSYTSQDCAFMMNDIVTNYGYQGGRMQVPAGGYANTGQSTSYTFQIQTILQAVQTIQSQLSPANYWWYAEPSNSTVQYGKSSTTPQFLIIKGKHIDDIEIEATKENIKNVVYFTGGDDGTATSTNIFVKEQSSSSITANRRGLTIMSDNRVNAALLTSKAAAIVVADLIGNNQIAYNQAETYITTITVNNSTIDTTQMLIGKTVGFAGFGNFIDSLVLQIVTRNRTPDQSTFTVGTLPARVTQQIKDIQKSLAYLQTINNPSTAGS